MKPEHRGIGMTSQRTRERMIKRLQEQGIANVRVLDVMRTLPRHIFVDEALASRSYEDTALPIGYGSTHFSALHRRSYDGNSVGRGWRIG